MHPGAPGFVTTLGEFANERSTPLLLSLSAESALSARQDAPLIYIYLQVTCSARSLVCTSVHSGLYTTSDVHGPADPRLGANGANHSQVSSGGPQGHACCVTGSPEHIPPRQYLLMVTLWAKAPGRKLQNSFRSDHERRRGEVGVS